MAGKLKHSSSRKGRKHSTRKTHRKHSSRHTRSRRHTRRNRRREGGNAPVGYHLSGSWPSQMSLGQGADYFKYHEGQHGGATFSGAPLSAIEGSGLPAALRGPAHVGGIDNAMEAIRGLSDMPQAVGTIKGGRRRRHKGSRRRRNKSKKGARSRRHKKRGGALGFAPYPSAGMLLSSPTQYAQAGLNPQWKTDVAFDLSKVRDSQ